MSPWKKTLGVLVAFVSATLGACGKNPIQGQAAATVQYIAGKKAMTLQLEKALTGGATANYRLIPIAGPVYGIGVALDPQNPLDVVTRECAVPDSSLPAAEPWSAFPSWTSGERLDLAVGLPNRFSSALASAGVSLAADHSGTFGLSNLSQRLLSRDELVSLLSKTGCAKALDGRDVVVVRGLISGREQLGSTRQLSGDLKVKVLKSTGDDLKLTFDAHSAFELADETAVPKFAVVSTLLATTRNESTESSIVQPDAAFIEKALEADAR